MKTKPVAPIVIEFRKLFPEWKNEDQGYVIMNKGRVERFLTEYENKLLDGELATLNREE